MKNEQRNDVCEGSVSMTELKSAFKRARTDKKYMDKIIDDFLLLTGRRRLK